MKGKKKICHTQVKVCYAAKEKHVWFTLSRWNTIPLSLLLEGSEPKSSLSKLPAKTSQCDPQHCLSRQHNELSVHPETHRALDTKNNFSLFLQSKITGPRLAQAHHKHSGSPQQAVNYWLLAGKLGNFKDDKIPGVYNM